MNWRPKMVDNGSGERVVHEQQIESLRKQVQTVYFTENNTVSQM